MVANSFDHGGCAGITNSKALTGHAAEERLAAGRAIKNDIADQNVLFRCKSRSLRRIDNQPATGESLANIIDGISFKGQSHALGEECAEALASGTIELDANRVVWQACRSVAPCDFAAEHRANRPVHITNRKRHFHRRASFQCSFCPRNQLVIERLVQAMVLRVDAMPCDTAGERGIEQYRGKINALGL